MAETISNVKVCCRFRPMTEAERRREVRAERNRDGAPLVEYGQDGSGCTVFISSGRKANFSFDHTFEDDASQEVVFEHTAAPMVEAIFDGYNTTIFAYGQTGSGKTHTMMGIPSSPQAGIIPRFLEAIFERIDQADVDEEFTVKLAYVEIYNEKIKDLLQPDQDNLRIRESTSGVWIEDVTEQYVGDMEGVLDVMQQGTANRAIASTNMNDASSRSHSVFILTLGQRNRKTGSKKGAKLFLVDLAGSEKVRKTGSTGQTLTEAQHINRSLSALGNVINKLSTGIKQHIPYRDSKLTRLLSDALGGNSRTCLVVTAAVNTYNMEETVSTLRFGTRAKAVKNRVVQNVEKSVEEYKSLLERCHRKIRLQSDVIAALQVDLRATWAALEQLDPDSVRPDQTSRRLLKQLNHLEAIERADRDNNGSSYSRSGYSSGASTPRTKRSNSLNIPGRRSGGSSEPGSPRSNRSRSPRGSRSPRSPRGSMNHSLSMTTPERERESRKFQSNGNWTPGDQMLIINESDGEDEFDQAATPGAGRQARRSLRFDQKEMADLRMRVRELEDTLQRTRAEQQAQARAKLSEQETRIVSMREEFNEQLGVARQDARQSALEAQALEARVEEFGLLKQRVELMESQHATELEVEQGRRQELILENEELVAQVLALRHANAKNRVYSDPEAKAGAVNTSPSTQSGSRNVASKNEHTIGKLNEQNQSLQRQLKLVESKLGEANADAHMAQEKNLARVAKLEKQLAQASVMCEKLLQSSMYWRDRRQAMTRARIMIPIQGGGHGRTRNEKGGHKTHDQKGHTDSGRERAGSSGNKTAVQRDSIDRFF